ncbi:hypothetical protein EAX61_04860 [Dokdonia sinensis]|uniref:Uncharacterized protein n=1 Tax=Dokdonia sinensis TaxID=2479847 RepID=A0A3M0GF33_9FLAO|nr:hypothetical protein [Dokdonia sinensis]RMB62908.1 hypothetical protein EAX61_04860 [Dokdonia sinensis]
MMTLQVISEDKRLLHAIAEDLLKEKLIANAMISEELIFKEIGSNDTIAQTTRHLLKGVSKSLLFNKINLRLRETYKERMPLLYAEPIIMIDAEQTEGVLAKLQAV